MGITIAEITMSLDGFIAGPGISYEDPLGRNGERLHDWLFDSATETDQQIANEIMSTCGAVILGNRTYTTAIGDAWGGKTPFQAPAFVICHNKPEKKVDGFSYVSAGIHEALRLAKETAVERPVWVMGGAAIIQQYLAAGLINKLRIHIASILLKQGTRLFENTGTEPVELIKEKLMETPAAVHTIFRLKK